MFRSSKVMREGREASLACKNSLAFISVRVKVSHNNHQEEGRN